MKYTKKIITEHIHEKNTLSWVCYATNVRKRRFIKQIMRSTKKIDKELYIILMESMCEGTNPPLTTEYVHRLFCVAKKIPTSIIKE